MMAGYLRHFFAVLSRSGSGKHQDLQGNRKKRATFFARVLIFELILVYFKFGHLSGELLHGFGSLQ